MTMDEPDSRTPEAIDRVRREAVEVASRMISGELGVIAGCRLLTRLGHRLVEDWTQDPDFVVFGAIESETDHLPLEDQRVFWNPAAFEEKQREVATFEQCARADVLAACKSVVARYRVG